MAPPIYKTKNGQFSAAIFENPKGNSIALQKSFTDKDSNWQQQSITLFPRNVDQVIEVLQKAKEQCESKETTTETKPKAAPEEEAASSCPPELLNLPGGDELIIEEEEEIADEGDRSEMEEFIEEFIIDEETQAVESAEGVA